MTRSPNIYDRHSVYCCVCGGSVKTLREHRDGICDSCNGLPAKCPICSGSLARGRCEECDQAAREMCNDTGNDH